MNSAVASCSRTSTIKLKLATPAAKHRKPSERASGHVDDNTRSGGGADDYAEVDGEPFDLEGELEEMVEAGLCLEESDLAADGPDGPLGDSATGASRLGASDAPEGPSELNFGEGDCGEPEYPSALPFFRVAGDSVAMRSAIQAVKFERSAGQDELKASGRQRARDHRGPTDRCISLVRARSTEDDGAPMVMLVRWEVYARRTGRPVRLDERNRVIYQLMPIEDFKDAVLLIPDVMMMMRKVTQGGRSPLPEWVNLLWRAEEARMFAGPIGDDRPCVACKQAARMGTSSHLRPSDGDIFVCHQCLCSWHMDCCRKMAAELDSAGGTFGLHNNIDGTSFVCALCSE